MLKLNIPDFDLVEDCISFGRKVALFTFLIGSAILAAYYVYNDSSFLFLSLFFMVASFFTNTFIFIKLLLFWISNQTHRKKIRNTMVLLLLNIPIAYAYVKIGLEITSKSFSVQ